MANKSLFKSIIGNFIRETNTVNHEAAPAYKLTAKQALAQLASTGSFNRTFYADGEEQLDKVLELCSELDAEFIARCAVYARRKGYMKDMPALLCAVLAIKDSNLLRAVFPVVIDNAKMLRTFVQIVRSGVVGRKSLGSCPKHLVQEWFETRTDDAIFRSNIGQDPSLADVIKMVHPKPASASRNALYGYILGRPYEVGALPELVQSFESFKKDQSLAAPDVPFQMLTALDLGVKHWTEIAKNARWQMTRMNLNTFLRKGVFRVDGMIEMIANRLSDPAEIRKARVFPYQLLAAYRNANSEMPAKVRNALQDAMETAICNIPELKGKIYVCPDVSGSMTWSVTGSRKGATSKVRCIDVAALVAAAFIRKNQETEVLPFEHRVVNVHINARDSVMTNAQRLSSIGGGGTNCSAPLRLLNQYKAKGDLVVFISDNESWVDAKMRRGTAMMQEWNVFKTRNPKAKLVCLDIQPYTTTQAYDREDILNIGGFSDRVFSVISDFASGNSGADLWVKEIEAIEVDVSDAKAA